MIRPAAPALLALTLLSLAACERQPADPVIAAAAKAAHIPCALAGSASFAPDCTIEKMITGDGLALVMHHPDGGFRRLLVTSDGRGVIAADGADEARVVVIDPATIEVTVGKDRYRLPATVKGESPPAK